MKLTNKQVKRYINLFEEPDYKKMLKEQAKDKKIKWYIVKNKDQESDYTYYLYNSIGYDDEFGKYWFNVIMGEYEKLKYRARKLQARQEAIDYQSEAGERCLSYSELAERTNYFERLGKRYGLLKEFRENGII